MISPRESNNRGSELSRDLAGIVSAPGIRDHDLANEVPGALQAGPDRVRLVLDNHRKA
jgi:hypothetical protein